MHVSPLMTCFFKKNYSKESFIDITSIQVLRLFGTKCIVTVKRRFNVAFFPFFVKLKVIQKGLTPRSKAILEKYTPRRLKAFQLVSSHV